MQKNDLSKMVMRLFALKGKTGYTTVDVDTWVDFLQNYNRADLSRAFNACLQKDGFFEIKHILDELKPSGNIIAQNEWENIMQVARDGGQGYDNLSDASKHSLRIAGGLQKLRVTESDYTRNDMRKIFIETHDVNKKEIAYDENSRTFKFLENFSNKLIGKK